jgi:NAD(P)-dependent dehydrogenase (short-subunit alcohol dehydrogenase family)
MELAGKKALVFGGTSGIGLATAIRLKDRGASVTVISRDPQKHKPVPAGVTVLSCNVLDRDQLQALFRREAPFDILVSAATGGARAYGPILSMDMDGYRGSFDKLWGYVHVVRYGTAHMPDHGAIVLVSGAPARRAKPGQVALSSVGGAVEAFVRAVAVEIAPKRLNVVSPGTIDTPMMPGEGPDRKALLDTMTDKNVIPRAGTPDEVAQAILFMIENDFVTGTTIDVDGGWILS